MTTTRLNGNIESTSIIESSKCNCCPYGFHIDLGFVDFIENVTNKTDTIKVTKDRNGTQKNLLKSFTEHQDSTADKSCSATTDQLIGKTSSDPLSLIFSDSLEKVVSDFEETLNSRESNSKRKLLNPLNDTRKIIRRSGYFSDYGTMQINNQSLPPKIPVPVSHETVKRKHVSQSQAFIPSHNDAASSSSKSLFVPETQQQYGYHTALGKAMSEIKSKHQNDQLNDDFQKTLFTPDNIRVQDFRNTGNRIYDIGSFQEPKTKNNRSLYEQGKTHYLGSRTPDMPRRSFTLMSPSSHKHLNDVQPQWRMRSSVDRSSSVGDIQGFVSMRRQKTDDNTTRINSKPKPPIPYPRNSSFFSERLRRDRNPSSHSQLNFSTVGKYSTTKNLNDIKVIGRTSIGNNSNEIIENNLAQLTNGNTLTARSEDPKDNVNVNGLCFQYYDLQNQLSDLSYRLKQSTDEMKNKGIGENLRTNNQNKNIGESFEMFDDGINDWIKVGKKDTASDPLLFSVNDKETSISVTDLIEMQWCKNTNTSPIPKTSTDKLLDSSSDVTINGGSNQLKCDTEAIITNDVGCGNDLFAVMCDFTTMTDIVELVETGTGNEQCISLLKNSSSMTTPITTHSQYIQTESIQTRTICISTSPIHLLNHSIGAEQVIQKDSYTVCDELMRPIVNDAFTEMDRELSGRNEIQQRICCNTVAVQTEFEPEQNEPRIIADAEIAESLWLIPPKDRKDVAVGNEDDIIEQHELMPQPSDQIKPQMKLMSDSDDEDVICVVEETLSDPEDIDFENSKSQLSSKELVTDNSDIKNSDEPITEMKTSRTLGHARAAIVRKMLTEKSQPLSFIRGTTTSRSWRPTSKKGDPLQYIIDQHKTQGISATSTPQTTKSALEEKVNLKKDVISTKIPLSRIPEPVPARIPRPKISKYIPGDNVAQSPDEEAEIADRLTPLRSEMRALRTYTNGRAVKFSRPAQPLKIITPRISLLNYDKMNNSIVLDDSSSSSSDSEGSYNTNEVGLGEHFECTLELSEAIEILKEHFQKPDSVESSSMDWATKHAKHEWFKTVARKTSSAIQVEGFIDLLEAASDDVMKFVINLADPNGNTALHYAVSHGNFDVVSVLLDSRVCNLDRANKAGYTVVMLASLCDASDEVEAAVIHRLFQLGDVNAQAVQHGQTALMLAVSHGKINTTKLLIDCQADLNIQDEEGSTALMCAAEHGHKEIVKLLLQQQDIDASLSDCDSSTALSIAVENGHRDIGVLIYAHLNHSCKQNQKQQKDMESNS